VQVEFASKKLRDAYESKGKAIRRFGEAVGKKYVERINILKSARERNDLRKLRTLRIHEYKGNRAGDFGIDLTGNVRLIVTFPSASTVRVENVEDPHGH
jgi:toxin HigB-1